MKGISSLSKDFPRRVVLPVSLMWAVMFLIGGTIAAIITYWTTNNSSEFLNHVNFLLIITYYAFAIIIAVSLIAITELITTTDKEEQNE